MNQKLRQILFGMALVITGASYAQINVSTGWNSGVVPYNTPEDSWTVTTPGNTVVTPKSCHNYTLWGESGCSNWISTAVSSNGVAVMAAQGTYTYRMNFTITAETINCARFVINAIGADNSMTGFAINNNSYFSLLGMPGGNNNFNPLRQNVSFNINPAHLNIGTNTIMVTVSNNQNSEMGFNLCGQILINEDFNIHPVVTGPTTICQGSPLTFGGSLASGSNPSTHYYWRLYECDAAGNIVTNGFYWESPWSTGVPSGNYTFPANLNVICGKYYMAVLSAVKESSCANWAQDIHVFNYACKPNANAGADQTICQGECATIGTNILQKGVAYSWMANGNMVGTGASMVVCPNVTTTYTVTSAFSATSCWNTDQVVITVLPNNPDFNIQTHAYDDYYTVTATPVVMNANTVPGFGAYWAVEDVVGSSYQFYFQNPYDWQPYPASLNFVGFDDYLLNYMGIYNVVPPAPTNGRFVFNKTYRITRGTWNNNCEWNAVSYLLNKTKSANGEDEITITPTKAPAFKPIIQQATSGEWNVSPNPSTGIFNIVNESSEVQKTEFEVFDVSGKKIATKVAEEGTHSLSIDLSGNAKGLYILNVTTNGVSTVQKIAIE
ncbi:MAG: T9SS type A sorting domain-containing protein [Fluviicola sp.]